MKRLLHRIALYLFHVSFVRPLLYWGIGTRFRRKSLVPKGPCLVVSNHNSHLDAGILMTLFPLRRIPRVHPVAAADYFGSTWLKKTLAMMMMNGIPIQRRPSRGIDPLTVLADRLKTGDTLIFFPEGSRGKAGVVSRFRPGVGRLVHQVPGLLVLPVFLSGPERIWPRGQRLPVPVSIDVIVGRPRTYSTDDEPRAIADQVQRDVMSLAPPPPPVPSGRPPPPIRVAVCGIDAEHREAVFRNLTRRLGRTERTLGIADPLLESDGDGLREVTAPVPHARGRAWLGLLATVFRTGRGFKGEKFVEMVEKAQIDEALEHGRAARFVVTDGSALVDLMAWAEAEFYAGVFDESGLNHIMQYLAGQKKIGFANWWRFIRKAPEVWLVNVFDLARPPVPDVVVHVSTPIESVMRRLRSGGEELEKHQREPVLERVQEGYRQVGRVLKKRRKVEFFDFDVSRIDAEQLSDEVEAVCRRLVEEPIPKGARG